MTRTIRLTLAYEGTAYSGWQAQPGRATVQGSVAGAILSVSGETLLPKGSSRTDAGVHALGQVAVFESAAAHDAATWARALNCRLPPDITVVEAVEVPAGYDPVRGAVSKIYRYRIHDAPWRPVLSRRLVWRWKSRLDETAMRGAAAALVGEHDFTSFETTPSSRVSKVRTIHRVDLFRRRGGDDLDGSELWIEVEGNGFLHNMVRIIVGSLVMVGCGRRAPEWMETVIAARSRPAAGPTAPPQGLVLVSIEIDPLRALPPRPSPAPAG